MDNGFKQSEKMLKELEAKIHKEYAQAAKEMGEKVDAYFAKFEKENIKKEEAVKQGRISAKEYNEWRMRKMATGKRYIQMRNTLAKDLTNVDKIAMKYVNDRVIDVYALNMNYGTYSIEKDSKINTSFTLYNRDAVQRLIKSNPQMLPQPKVDIPKDLRWNQQHIQSAITQGILQGKSIPDIAKNLQNVVGMDERAAIRNARTAMTGAQNGGRLDSMKRAAARGVGLKKGWMATLDHVTRDSHVDLDGEVQELDSQFSNGLMFPGDPSGRPAEVYNCRCRLTHEYDKYKTDWSNPAIRNTEKIGNMSYQEWKDSRKGKATKIVPKAAKAVAIVKGITKSPFVAAQTISQAESFTQEFVQGGMNLTGKQVSFKGIDIEMANAINETLNDVYWNFDIDKLASVEAFGKANKKIYQQNQDAPFFTTNFGNLGINSTILKDSKTLDKYNQAGKESFELVMNNIDKLTGKQKEIAQAYQTAGKSLVGNSVEDMVRHEIGHHISYMPSVNKELAALQKSDEWKEYAKNISGYANHSFGEYVAESFNSYCKGKYEPLQPDLIAIFDGLRRK